MKKRMIFNFLQKSGITVKYSGKSKMFYVKTDKTFDQVQTLIVQKLGTLLENIIVQNG